MTTTSPSALWYQRIWTLSKSLWSTRMTATVLMLKSCSAIQTHERVTLIRLSNINHFFFSFLHLIFLAPFSDHKPPITNHWCSSWSVTHFYICSILLIFVCKNILSNILIQWHIQSFITHDWFTTIHFSIKTFIWCLKLFLKTSYFNWNYIYLYEWQSSFTGL